MKTNVMQQNAADKGTKGPIYFQNFRKSMLHPQKNSTTHEKVVEKNKKTWYIHVGAAICRPLRPEYNPCG